MSQSAGMKNLKKYHKITNGIKLEMHASFLNNPDFFLLQTGNLCYVKQYGSKYYDMQKTKSIKEKLTVETPLGNVDATVKIMYLKFKLLLKVNLKKNDCAIQFDFLAAKIGL